MRSLQGVLGVGLVVLSSACDPMVVPVHQAVAGRGHGEWMAQWWRSNVPVPAPPPTEDDGPRPADEGDDPPIKK